MFDVCQISEIPQQAQVALVHQLADNQVSEEPNLIRENRLQMIKGRKMTIKLVAPGSIQLPH